ncbi:hypothetical protein MGYG_00676 [Nannizzia gypsea CBS 118893]|uniref:Uncharacterized protein n=1 Tax=Arthroderma gypseum (strain ATCC MYA-4604 / CBS 118893) TaxID=535722 RepID=E5R134_ARTGP|nr:hypothetical protein MGYG_00676 [Nannizzia gypsea CBS 118893]EFQ97638.1 hypothetical protein MGYG_00676 [Nannizzia gypsea CBS 118893]
MEEERQMTEDIVSGKLHSVADCSRLRQMCCALQNLGCCQLLTHEQRAYQTCKTGCSPLIITSFTLLRVPEEEPEKKRLTTNNTSLLEIFHYISTKIEGAIPHNKRPTGWLVDRDAWLKLFNTPSPES